MGKQVKTPRFYVDIPTFLHATGQLDWDLFRGGAELLYMNPSNPVLRDWGVADDPTTMYSIGHANNNQPKTSFPINFCALLNHNLASDALRFSVVGKKGLTSNDGTDPRLHANLGAVSNVLNTPNPTYGDLAPSYNGTNIWTFSDKDGENEYWRSFEIYFPDGFNDYSHQIGSFVVGKYWDAPNSPDLSLTMSRRFDGIKKQKTIGGKTLANIYYDGPTEWTMNHPDDGTYKYPPFELDYPLDDFASEIGFNARAKSGLGRKGLRSWNLTFSYISEDNMWMENEVSNTLISDDTDFSNTDANPMLSDNSFNFVWNCTLGGTLPFIFQPDNSETGNNPDRFAICTFRQNTLSVKQVAYNTYTLSITIDEVA
tara:strand:+ start:2992 stop:4101 length:1110 start_codon:yes stop_codon:yes gene_type:complete